MLAAALALSGITVPAIVPGVVMSGVFIEYSDGSAADRQVAATISDVLDYWETQPLPGVVADTSTPRFIVYGGDQFWTSAVWDNTIGAVMWNRDATADIDPHEVAAIMAHELGHWADFTYMSRPAHGDTTILREQRADCLAGSYAAWAGWTGTLLDDAIYAAAVSGNDPGWTTLDKSHGFPVNRVSAFARGYQHGAAGCVTITREGIDAAMSAVPFDGEDVDNRWTQPRIDRIIEHTAAVLGMGLTHAAIPSITELEAASWRGDQSRLRGDGAGLGRLLYHLSLPWLTVRGRAGDRSARLCVVGALVRSLTPAGELSGGDADEALLNVVLEDAAVGHAMVDASAYLRGVHGMGSVDACLADVEMAA